MESIIRIEAHGGNSLLFFQDGICVESAENIDHLEEEITNGFFFRIHPLHLINLNFMSRIHLGASPSVEMSDGSVVPLQPENQAELLKYFEKYIH